MFKAWIDKDRNDILTLRLKNGKSIFKIDKIFWKTITPIEGIN